MKKYRFLEHTADVFFEAYGDSFETALENAAEAMFSVMSHSEKLGEERSFTIEEQADSLENLTVFTLSTILSESEIEQVLPKRFKVKEFAKEGDGFRVRGEVFGGEWDGRKIKTSIKAVTHHLLRIQKNGKVSIRVLLDI